MKSQRTDNTRLFTSQHMTPDTDKRNSAEIYDNCERKKELMEKK